MADLKRAHEEREEWVRRISKAQEQMAADGVRRSAPEGTHPAAPALHPAYLCPAHQVFRPAASDRAAENSR